MFKRKVKVEKAEEKKAAAPKPPMEERSKRIERLAKEIEMWRKFAESCSTGRNFSEYASFYGACGVGIFQTTMDEVSAPAWKAFAYEMGAQSERRLKEILCCC